MVTRKDFVKGNKFRFKYDSKELVFIGIDHRGGRWYDLAKIEEPDVVWSSVCESDFKLLERIID